MPATIRVFLLDMEKSLKSGAMMMGKTASAGGGYRAPGEDTHEVGAIGGAAMQIGAESVCAHLGGCRRSRCEAARQRLFQRLAAEHRSPCAGDCNADTAGSVRNEHSDQRETRARVAETSRTQPFSGSGSWTAMINSFGSSAVSYMPREEIVGGDLDACWFAPSRRVQGRPRDNRRRDHCSRASHRGPHVAHLAVADAFSQRRQRGNRRLTIGDAATSA